MAIVNSTICPACASRVCEGTAHACSNVQPEDDEAFTNPKLERILADLEMSLFGRRKPTRKRVKTKKQLAAKSEPTRQRIGFRRDGER